jgi:hypothetical protein
MGEVPIVTTAVGVGERVAHLDVAGPEAPIRTGLCASAHFVRLAL